MSRLLGLLQERGKANFIPDHRIAARNPSVDAVGEFATPNIDYVVSAAPLVMIEYRSADGRQCIRPIAVKSIKSTQRGDLIINAYCYHRRAKRSFRADRIQSLVDPATGEVLPYDSIESLVAELSGAHFSLSERLALQSTAPGVQSLLFLARCDGTQHENETEIVLDYIDHCSQGVSYDYDRLGRALSVMQPDAPSFLDAIQALHDTSPNALERVARFAVRLIHADGVLTSEEEAFFRELHALQQAA